MSLRADVFGQRMRMRRLVRVLHAQWFRAWWPGWHAAWGAQVGRGCRIVVEPRARIVVAESAEIDDGVTLAALGAGRLELGSRCFIGHHSTLAARDLVRIGSGTFLAEMVSVRDHDHEPELPPSSGVVRTSRVEIGANVWIAAKASVLRGVRIGAGSVVAAHAVVRDDVPASSVVAGVPARVVRRREEGEQ